MKIKQLACYALESVGYKLSRLPTRTEKCRGNRNRALEHLLAGIDQPVIFDVGANDGQSWLQFRSQWPSSKISCFEPLPTVFGALQRKIAGDAETNAYNLALGNTVQEVEMWENERSVTSSLLASSQQSIVPENWAEPKTKHMVTVERLDHFSRERQIERIDLLKIDTQGYELEVLKGAGNLLSQGRIRVILAEMLFAQLYEGQCHGDEVMGYLRKAGYQFYGLYGQCFELDRGTPWADGLFFKI